MFKLVIVDDDKYFIDGIKKHINFSDFDIELVGSANNGKQGLELINSAEPDIVISDIDMPQMSGIEMLKEISNSYSMPLVILLTGLDSFEYAKEAVYLNAFAYLTKPVFPPEICKVLKSAVSRLSTKSLYSEYDLSHAISHRNKQAFLECSAALSDNINNLKVFEPSDVHRVVFMIIKSFADTFVSGIDCAELLSDLKDELYTLHTKESIAGFLSKSLDLLNTYLTTSRANTSAKTLEKIKHYIDENYSSSELSINNLSEQFNISPNYLRTLFKEKYQISFKDYLTTVRLEKAEEMILSGDFKIYEVANMVGYGSVSRFRAEYKLYFGHLPSSR